MEDYDINAIASDKDYTLLFDVRDRSFNDPYSTERLILKFGIRFLDMFPPPKTEGLMIEERTEGIHAVKYLVWGKNSASDTASYDIYVKKIEKGIGGAKTEKPDEIGKMSKKDLVKGETEWKIEGLTAGDYYFYIIANDEAGNSANGINIEPVELSI